jgi:hypothetical protein
MPEKKQSNEEQLMSEYVDLSMKSRDASGLPGRYLTDDLKTFMQFTFRQLGKIMARIERLEREKGVSSD